MLALFIIFECATFKFVCGEIEVISIKTLLIGNNYTRHYLACFVIQNNYQKTLTVIFYLFNFEISFLESCIYYREIQVDSLKKITLKGNSGGHQ